MAARVQARWLLPDPIRGKYMNVLRFAIWAAIGSLLLWSFEAVASEDYCSPTAAQRASSVAAVARRLHNHDPLHAAKMSKVASEIINGDVDALKSDIDSGLDSNAVLKLGEKSVSDMSLLTLAAADCQRVLRSNSSRLERP
jgi:hypothetical protein